MRERINRLARGIIDNGSPELVLTPERVEASVPAACKGFRLFLPAVADPGNTAGSKADQEDHQQRYKHWGKGPAPCMFQGII